MNCQLIYWILLLSELFFVYLNQKRFPLLQAEHTVLTEMR